VACGEKEMKTFRDGNTEQHLTRSGDIAQLIMGIGFNNEGEIAASAHNTGNGYIIRFPAHNCTQQDYYVCLDYAQAYDLILVLSAFKKDLGFRE
jgi:hypothetical protein